MLMREKAYSTNPPEYSANPVGAAQFLRGDCMYFLRFMSCHIDLLVSIKQTTLF